MTSSALPEESDPSICKGCGASLGSQENNRYCPACTLAATSFQNHQRIGPYIIDSLLGEGGMGEVFLAFHETTGRAVALKLPLHRGSQPHGALLKRFTQEMHVLSLLDHPGILPIYEVSDDPRQPWFAMKLAESGTLADLLKDGDSAVLPAEKAAHIMAEIAAAVQHAHDHGILHRDLKPQNIFMDEAGHPMLGDFGLAKPAHEQWDMSRTMAALGTPAYAAPEISQGQAPSAAADIFSMGAILYHLLAGHPPFHGKSLTSVLEMARHGKAEPLVRKDVPKDLWHVCQKCLEPEPEDRYATAQTLERDLLSWINGRGISIRKPSPLVKLSRLVKRNPLVTVLVLTTAIAVIVSLSIILASNERLLKATRIENEARKRMALEQRHLERLEYVQLLLGKHQAGHRTEALELLREEWPHKPGAQLRSLAIKALCLGELTKEDGEAENLRARYSPSGKPQKKSSKTSGRTAISSGPFGRQLTILKNNGQIEAKFAMLDAVTALEWNDTGNRLAIGTLAKDTFMWEVGSSHPSRHIRARESATRRFLWHSSERYIACVTEMGSLHLWDLERRQDLCSYNYGIAENTPISWSQKNLCLEWKDEHGQLERVHFTPPNGVRMLQHDGAGGKKETFCSIELDAKNSRVLWVTDDGAHLWDWQNHLHNVVIAKNGSEWMGARFVGESIFTCGWSSGMRSITNEDYSQVKQPDFSNETSLFTGDVLIASSNSEPPWLGLLERPFNRFLLVRPGQKKPSYVLNHKDPFAIAFSNKGDLAVTSSFNDNTIYIWSLIKEAATKRLTLNAESNASNLSVTPDGKIIATNNSRGITLWDIATGAPLSKIQGPEPYHSVAWSPDGQIMAAQSSRGTQLYNALDGTLIADLSSPVSSPGNRFVSLTFDRHLPLLAEQLEDGSVIVWDLETIRRLLRQLGFDWSA